VDACEVISRPESTQAAKTCPSLSMINCRRSMLSWSAAAPGMSSDEGAPALFSMAFDGIDQHRGQFRPVRDCNFKSFQAIKKRIESTDCAR
jgi:hypothetical protein